MSTTQSRSRFAAALLAAAVLPLAACAKPLEITIPDTLVAPGSTVAVEETVLVPGSAYERRDDSRHITDAEVALTVAKVVHEDNSWFEELNNPEDFAGYTPVLVSTQVNVPEDSGLESPNAAAPYGVLDNGEFTEYMTLEDYTSSTKFCWGSSVGATGASFKLRCTILLVPEGAALASIQWDGQQTTMGLAPGEDDPIHPYLQDPLTFEVPAEQ